MTVIRPFCGIRPAPDLAASVAALPYDVYTRDEARDAVDGHPLSFLNIDRPETQFPKETDMYADTVYKKARSLMEDRILDGTFLQDTAPCFYLYSQSTRSHSQTGLVCCASVDDYLSGAIRKHENTLAAKELDRIRHIDALGAQTGPIFLAYRPKKAMKKLAASIQADPPLYDFTADDHVRHQVWKISCPEKIKQIQNIFRPVERLYIADGHHRAASAVKVALKCRTENPGYTGAEEFNYFLSVLFPEDELKIYDYNRVISDLNGCTSQEFLDMIKNSFETEEITGTPARPSRKGEFGMYLDSRWYLLRAEKKLLSKDPVDGLDVSLLQNHILEPLLGIRDPKTDPRITFLSGIRGSRAVEDAAGHTGVGFILYPTSMKELLDVADAGRLMPPKSTWFEPKLRSGLLIHRFRP